MTDEKKMQQKYMELQMMNSQISQVQKQIQSLDNQLMELMLVNKSLDDFEEVKKGTEVLVSLSPGIYAKAELKNNKDLIVNVGSNVVVKKNIVGTKKIINNQLKEMKTLQEQMIVDLQKLILKTASVEQEINRLISKKK